MPTPRARRVIIVAFAGAQGLDIFGPAEVFGSVGRTVASQHRYEVIAVGSRSGQLPTTCGIPLTVRAASSLSLRATDTVLVSGGDTAAVSAAVSDRALVAWIARAASRVRRIGSVCSGAFVLAAAGILDGLAAATHWSACASLARFRPQIAVDRESIFVRAGARGHIWTSAGVTTGIDMALAIVEEDLGRAVADGVAARLVLHARRPGTQSQWSDALVAQQEAGAPLASAVTWLRAHVREPLAIDRLARHCAMSPRTLHRRCLEHLQLTPRQLIEKVRVDEARALLETTALPIKVVAARCGFGDALQMARAFTRVVGLAPTAYRVVAGAARVSPS